MSSKRLEILEKLTAAGSTEPFAWYGLAMEYRAQGRVAEALAAFEQVRLLDAAYQPGYLMAGQLLLEQGRRGEARQWLEAGIDLARRRKDAKTLSELEAALAEC